MTVIARQLRQVFDQQVERTGLTRAKWTLIASVARNPGATQRTIATLLEVTDATAGRLIDRLCADGYLERREDPQDRRAHSLYLTPVAQPLLSRLAKIAEIYEEATFAGFSDEDLEKLDELLGLLSRNLAKSKNCEGAQSSRSREEVPQA